MKLNNTIGLLLLGVFFVASNCNSQEENKSLFPIRVNKKWGYINKKGEVVIEPKFNSEVYSFSEGLALVEINNKIGYTDQKGNYVWKEK